jgi:DNA-binding transcriptional regulator LsrR (DeoR family)
VCIEICTPGVVDADLSAQLQDHFRLRHAIVLDLSDDDPAILRARLGESAAELLSDIATAEDVIGLAWARSLGGIGNLNLPMPACAAVQLTGALTGPDGSDVLELVRRVARAGGGAAHVFYAPLVVADAATARTLRRQPDVARAAAMVSQVTIAAVGIGAWSSGQSTIYDMIDPASRAKARALGTRAEISGAFIDEHGHHVDTPLGKRIIGVTADQLAKIDTVLAVAYGEGKADAVRYALKGGLLNALVTHSALARKILADSLAEHTSAETAVPSG